MTDPVNLETVFASCEGAYSPKTLQGYRKDLECFKRWCNEKSIVSLPAEAGTVSRYVDDLSTRLSIATIKRRLCAIRFAHFITNLKSPIGHSCVHLAVRRASRSKQRRPTQSLGLTGQVLQKILASCSEDLTGIRDAALISTGYDTLCRSSELAAIQVEHVRFSAQATSIIIPFSKSDPFGDGRTAYLSPQTSALLKVWLERAVVDEGPVFRGLHTGKIGSSALDTSSIRRLIKAAARRADLPEEIVQSLSGHSMRIGAAQDMMVTGFDQLAIMQAGGWKTASVVLRYVENAATQALHKERWDRLRKQL